MATFLELVQDVARETGTLAGGTSLGSVVGTSGRAAKLVSWVRKAWIHLQTERRDWIWMRREFESTVLEATAKFMPVSFSIDRMGLWGRDRCDYLPYTIYDPAIGVADETELREIPYDSWRIKYGRGYHDPDRPIEYAISPLNEFCVGPTPDQDYQIKGEYQLEPQVLALDADIPELPLKHHDIIVWLAIKLLANSDEALISVASSLNEYGVAKQKLERDQLPEIVIGWGGGAIDQ